jgi:hypothetical protein
MENQGSGADPLPGCELVVQGMPHEAMVRALHGTNRACRVKPRSRVIDGQGQRHSAGAVAQSAHAEPVCLSRLGACGDMKQRP